jgi:thiamine-phosphate pyrophosphorylase
MEDLLKCIARNVRQGVDYIQIREKDLSTRDLLYLTKRATAIAAGTHVRILVNDRADVALAADAHGVHLRANSIWPEQLRVTLPESFLIAVSCHSLQDIRNAQSANLIVFGPVFESPGKGPATGLDLLSAAAASSRVPVFALGGINEGNAGACLRAGAAGIAAIRLFQT